MQKKGGTMTMYTSKNKHILGNYIRVRFFFFRGVRKLPRNGLKALPGALFLNKFPWKILESLFFFFFRNLIGNISFCFSLETYSKYCTIAWDPKHIFFWERITSKHIYGRQPESPKREN